MNDLDRVSQKTLNAFYFSLTDLIYEYLHSFRDENYKTKLVSNDVIKHIRDNFMKYIKSSLDGTAELIVLEQKYK